MATEIITKLVDDMDGSAADETVKFALDGVAYEIDLNTANAAKLRNVLGDYVASGQRIGRTGGSGGLATRGANGDNRMTRERSLAIRTWAKGEKLEVSDRGRIPAEIVERYDNRHNVPAATFSAPEVPVEPVKATGAPLVAEPVKRTTRKAPAKTAATTAN